MSGFYSNWIKVQNPNLPNNIPQMESGGFQQPFFFGGSQVPVNLKLSHTDISGEGIYEKTHFMPEIKGKGVQSTRIQGSNIHMPRNMGSLNRQF